MPQCPSSSSSSSEESSTSSKPWLVAPRDRLTLQSTLSPAIWGASCSTSSKASRLFLCITTWVSGGCLELEEPVWGEGLEEKELEDVSDTAGSSVYSIHAPQYLQGLPYKSALTFSSITCRINDAGTTAPIVVCCRKSTSNFIQSTCTMQNQC